MRNQRLVSEYSAWRDRAVNRPIDTTRQLMREREALLHPTNLLMGMFYLDACMYLETKHFETEEWVGCAVKGLQALE